MSKGWLGKCVWLSACPGWMSDGSFNRAAGEVCLPLLGG